MNKKKTFGIVGTLLMLIVMLAAVSTVAASSPTTVAPADRLKAAVLKMHTLNSAHVSASGTAKLTTQGGASFSVPFNVSGEADKAAKKGDAKGSLTSPIDGKVLSGSLIFLDNTVYAQNGTTGTWYKHAVGTDKKATEATNEAAKTSPTDGLKYLSNYKDLGAETINGVATEHIQATLDWAAVKSQIEAKKAGATDSVKSVTVTLDFWIGNDSYIYRGTVNAVASVDTDKAKAQLGALHMGDKKGTTEATKPEADTKDAGKFAALKNMGTVQLNLTATADFTNFNKSITVTAPANAVSK